MTTTDKPHSVEAPLAMTNYPCRRCGERKDLNRAGLCESCAAALAAFGS